MTAASSAIGSPARRAWLAVAAAGAWSLGSAVHAGAVDAADERAVREVIEAQLAAFAADDAEAAFGFAAPDIRRQFGDARAFLAMVRHAYPAVYRPSSVAFFQPLGEPDAVQQLVQLRDSAGRPWLAHYRLQRLPGLGWRIEGCVLRPDSGLST